MYRGEINKKAKQNFEFDFETQSIDCSTTAQNYARSMNTFFIIKKQQPESFVLMQQKAK